MEAEFLDILTGGYVVKCWMRSSCQATYLHIQVLLLELARDNLLYSFSYQIVTLVFTRQCQCSLVHEDPLCIRESGEGSPYLRQRSWRWLLQVVELLSHISRMYMTIL